MEARSSHSPTRTLSQALNPHPARRLAIVFRTFFAAALFLTAFGIARADTIWFVDESSPVFGIVESSSEKTISFQRTSDGTNFESVTIERAKISSIVVNFDRQRLSLLTVGDWQPWQDYAEELFAQKQDPVARNLATRLLAVVAGNSKEVQQRTAALNDLIALASNEDQKKKLLTIRYLETGVKPPVENVAQPKNIPSPEAREAAARLVQSIRRRRSVENELADQQIRETVAVFDDVCSWEELVKIEKSNRIDDQALRQLVALESALRSATENDSDAKQTDRDRDSWHLQAKRISANAFTLPTISSATGFDPELNRFVNGRWQE